MQEWTLGLDENVSYCHEFLITNDLEFFYKHVIGFSASQCSLLNMAPIIHIILVSVSHWCLQINTITLSWAILCYSKNILCKKRYTEMVGKEKVDSRVEYLLPLLVFTNMRWEDCSKWYIRLKSRHIDT